MERVRKPLQGIGNIIRFNWHYYLLSVLLVLVVFALNCLLKTPFLVYINIVCVLIILTIVVSLFVSYCVYDLSDLYKLTWLNNIIVSAGSNMVNIHAGFDETSTLLKDRFPDAALQVMDFYDPAKHTEVSIKRARRAYPAFPNTIKVETGRLPISGNSIETVFVILSAHEIRRESERDIFFSELKQILKPGGHIIVVEHLRDWPNFFAYNIGFFHFISRRSWHRTFNQAGLSLSREIKITPFITTFILEKHGTAS